MAEKTRVKVYVEVLIYIKYIFNYAAHVLLSLERYSGCCIGFFLIVGTSKEVHYKNWKYD